jgi:hypothetical protein
MKWDGGPVRTKPDEGGWFSALARFSIVSQFDFASETGGATRPIGRAHRGKLPVARLRREEAERTDLKRDFAVGDFRVGKSLKDHEKICWPPRLGVAVPSEGKGDTPGDPNVHLRLIAREILEPMPNENCVLVRCTDPADRGALVTTLSFGVEDAALQMPLFKFLSNQTGKTVAQIGETQVDF